MGEQGTVRDKAYMRKAVMAVICVFVLIFVPNYAQYQLSPLAFQIIPMFGMDAVSFSAVFSASMATGIVLSLASGLLCDRFGVKRMVGMAALITAAALIARIFVTDYVPLFCCMLLSGVTATFANSNIAKMMARWFDGDKIGIAVGVGMAGSMVAMMVGMSTSAYFPSVQSVFITSAIIAAVAAILWWVGFTEGPEGESAEAPAVDDTVPSFGACLKTVLKSRNIWIIGVALGVNLAVTMCIMTFLPQALVEVRGIAAEASGGITSIVTVGSLAGTLLMPILVARFSDMRPALAVFSIMAGLGTAFAWLLPEGPAMWAGLFLTGFCTSGIMPVLLAVPVQLPEIGPVYAGTAGGVAASLQLAGAVIVPTYILTPLFGGDFIAFYGAAAAMCAIMAACCLLLPKLQESR